VEKDEFGRPSALNEEQQRAVIARIDSGISISAIAREFSTTRQTVLRVKAAHLAPDKPPSRPA
jgi:putative DNA-invertase from lambdoid prophage Rac